jgi:hypothetical protein
MALRRSTDAQRRARRECIDMTGDGTRFLNPRMMRRRAAPGTENYRPHTTEVNIGAFPPPRRRAPPPTPAPQRRQRATRRGRMCTKPKRKKKKAKSVKNKRCKNIKKLRAKSVRR